MRIAISCDENPGDPGTQAGGLVERDVNIGCCHALVATLERCGVDAWFDPGITYQQRVAVANNEHLPLLVAIAHNAAASPDAEGAVFVFCDAGAHGYGRQDQAARSCGAQLVADAIVHRWGTYDEAVYECCNFKGDTVYCEVAYQSNPQDLAIIKSPGYAGRVAEALAAGLAPVYGFAYRPPGSAPAPAPAPAQPAAPAGGKTVLIHAVESNRVYVTDGVTKRAVTDPHEQDDLTRLFGPPVDVGQYTADRIPEIRRVDPSYTEGAELSNLNRIP